MIHQCKLISFILCLHLCDEEMGRDQTGLSFACLLQWEEVHGEHEQLDYLREILKDNFGVDADSVQIKN